MPEEEEASLDELLESIAERLQDSIKDMQTAIQCIQTYKDNPEKAVKCILEKLESTTEQPKPA